MIARTVIAAMLLAGAAPAVRAEIIAMTATLAGTAEVPPNTSPAKGSAEVQIDTGNRLLSWRIQYSGLTATLSAAHFHGPAAATANAGIQVPIAGNGAPSPLGGQMTISEQQAADLLAGRWYINLHTPTYPGGELRGQVVRK